MSALDPRDVDRFGKILGLLSSDHDGERAAAALKATEFLKARELSWPDISEMLKQPPVIIQQRAADPPRSHQMDARRCMQSPIHWKAHEKKFLSQMADQRGRPSEKQQDWLDALSDRVTRFNRSATNGY